MAFDKYLMELVRVGRWDFVLRTYGWEPACVSIGKLQNRNSEINCDLLLRDGYHVVRRPTGGRAVWHETELTYSITAGIEHPLVSGSISEALRKVSMPMVNAMNILDIPVSVSSSDRHRAGGPRMKSNPCFTSHGKWEVGTPDGRKLVGSAQARSRGVFLEHGSILFLNDQMKILDYLPHTTSTHQKSILAHHLKEGIACLREFKPDLEMLDLENALHSSFEDVLGEDLQYSNFEALNGERLNELINECRNEIQEKT
ncbi:MAG: lipoate--protein ligase family protein [Candidatus Aegiribacteria sp.]|nr:lipoate--protein ligase family protein [Candidatus Aegiribacteria sp.]